MRVLTWNLAFMKPGPFKALRNRQRQWALIAAITPDIALLQECRPEDLTARAPGWMVDEYDLIATPPTRWTGSAVVLARKDLAAVPVDERILTEQTQRWLAILGRDVAITQITSGGRLTTVASVYAFAGPVKHPDLSSGDHAIVKRPALPQAWYGDLAAAALEPLTATGPFIIGGDWNNAELFDTTFPATAPASAQFFAARAAAGWHDAMRKVHADEVRTYLDPASGPYELDRVFTDRATHSTLTGCHVLTEPSLTTLSDHAPVIAEFGSTA